MAELGQQDVFNLYSAPALPKGKACVTCRLRKIKCDGARPVCTQCREAQRSEDCEYVAVRAPSSTHALEKQAAALRARVKELQAQHASGSASLSEGHPVTAPPRHPDTALLDSGPGPSSYRTPSESNAIELSRRDTEFLVGLFFAQNQSLWFLNTDVFHATRGSQNSESSGALPALVLAIGAATASHPQASSFNETALVDAALSKIGPARGQPARSMQVLQAHVLLGAHLLRSGRFTQGFSLLSEGVSFALALGLHRPQPDTALTTFKPPRPILPTPNPTSGAEYVRGFWTVLVLERLWAMALGTPTRARLTANGGQDGGLSVYTPWPEQPNTYHDTLSFMRGPGPVMVDGDLPLTLSVKATLLLEQATQIASLMAEDEPSDVDGPEAQALDERINSFATALGPPVFAPRDVLVAHILLRGATLQLHSRIPGDLRAMNAARTLAVVAPVLQPIENEPGGLLEPAIGIVIPAACRALIAAMLSDGATTPANAELAHAHNGALDALQGILEAWETHSAYIGMQLNRVVQERSATVQ
ncbi:hypothetical protein PENSPDRAFT_646480 [Peniophora sp. CONT]|nr:hypothetical protein PENSPDRAFT_646480 [Peniophora sp. CONT]